MSTALDSPPASPVRIGPEGLPERTIGWQAFGWVSRYLQQPDGPTAGDPFRFTDEQARFLLWWYAIDGDGRFVYRTGMLRRMKGWGKDPLAAAICCIEFVGPCRFHRWAANGDPIAVDHPTAWVQIAAVAKEQTRTTLTLFPGMFSKAAITDYGIDLGKEIIYAERGSKRIEAVTSSPRALEGPRATFVHKNETHHWLMTNEGLEMSAVIARNAAKARDGSARVLATSNAHEPGEDSDAERDWDAWQKIESGQSRATGFLYDSVEAPPDTDLANADSLRRGLIAARGDSTWLDIDRLMAEIWDPRTPASTSRRFYLNQIVTAADAWIAPYEWDQVKVPDPVKHGDEITLGFDGSKSDDWCALVGCRVSDSELFTIGLWDPAEYPDNEVPRVEIDDAVKRAFDVYLVNGFYSDVHPWESYIDEWEGRWGEALYVRAQQRHAIGWDLRGRTREATQAVESFHDAILEHTLTHTGDKRADQHVYNARRRPNQYGVSFGKEHRESVRKVDWLSAAVLARLARQNYLTLPESKRRRRRTGRVRYA